MAVPPSMTILDITGTFTMVGTILFLSLYLQIIEKATQNKTLSDDTEGILALQGVPWWKRKAIGLATLTLAINHYKDDAGVEHIDIDQTLTGGIPGTKEIRILTWTERSTEDPIFGHIIGKSRRIKINSEELEGPFLKEGWTDDTITHGVVQSYVESDTPKSGTTWIANQVCSSQGRSSILTSESSQDLGDVRSH